MNIPGYYYDTEKRRYFKVENSKTAPSSAAWSSDNVKRRKLRDDDATAALRHADLAKDRIRRARALREPLTGGFFAREHGAVDGDMQAACFVEGLNRKGCIQLLPLRRDGSGMRVECMYIGGYDGGTGMCTAYAAQKGAQLYSAYIPRDENKRLDQRLLANHHPLRHHPAPPYIEAAAALVTDIQYHAPSRRILVASQEPLNCLYAFQPTTDDDGRSSDSPHPRWPLPCPGSYTAHPSPSDGGYMAHCVAPAPASSPLVCLVGTHRGILQWDGEGGRPLTRLTPHAQQQQQRSRGGGGFGDLFRSVLAVDFHPAQSEVFRFGGRPGALFTADRRERCGDWSYLRLPSAITHLRCLGGAGNQVLVAGLRDQLGVYDLRFARSRRARDGGDGDDYTKVDVVDGSRQLRWERGGKGGGDRKERRKFGMEKIQKEKRKKKNDGGGGGNGGDGGGEAVARPVIRFESYRNAARTDIGFAYDAATGVVAAAHDDVPGTVVLYSARTGSRLRVIDLAAERGDGGDGRVTTTTLRDLLASSVSASPAAAAAAAAAAERARLSVVQTLQFRTLQGDLTPTLFVADDRCGGVSAFSFDLDDPEDEG
ncbi:putative myocyte-specific enhancer factor 2d [Rosellinia necatrix]|uniref:Putative myocyte-specific enhancer factor 2d n=1 Tax=Rosellinia necatrix TaxID=77044 RepID=A0A1W2TIG1_ROSNE|nr:putative myocyte-specific enhancer factor 2d [Rosellinia necatrix]